MNSSHTVPLAILLGGIAIAATVYFVTPKGHPENAGNPALVRPVDTSDHILGNPAAKVMIVEYADFDCESCAGLDATLHEIVANEGTKGEVAWVYREFPLSEIHPNALRHAEAAECVAKTAGNDAFWGFATTLFEHQPVDPSQYGTLAAGLNIPGDAFATCFADAANTVDERIQADRQNAFAIGANGTPYSLIIVTGKPPVVMAGAYPYAAIKQLVEQALADAQ